MFGKRCALAVGLVCFVASSALAIPFKSYTGTLSAPAASGLDGTGVWMIGSGSAPPASFLWTVTQETSGGLWHYEYTLTVPKGGVSHFILETSLVFEEDDLVDEEGDFGGTDFGWFGPSKSNPGIPGPIYGIKFDETDGLVYSMNFDSPKDPVWGDFFAKDGKAGGAGFNACWNAGFGTAAQEADNTSTYYDPLDGPSNGSVNFHILVPDSNGETTQDVGGIAGAKWFDTNEDGIFDDDENGLEGWTIVLTDEAGAQISTTTDENGDYMFDDLAFGTYVVSEVFKESGWTQTAPLPIPPGTHTVTISESTPAVFEQDFGNFRDDDEPVPEPAMLVLLGLGTLGVASRRRRR